MIPGTHLITFSSRGRIGLINPDGTGERYLQFAVPNQVSWQLGPQFTDGHRFVVMSYEAGKPWEHQVQTHLWSYDFLSEELVEIATNHQLAPFMVCSALLPGDLRMVVSPIIDHEQRIFLIDLDGSHPLELTRHGEGFAYCVTLSPDSRQLAYHITGPGDLPYRICIMDLDGSRRITLAFHPDHLYFGPQWSPDGAWLLYQDCHFKTDLGHDWADLCIGHPDGSGHQVIAEGQRQWFGTSYGTPETRGGGSELPQWSPDGQTVTFTRAMPGSRTPWEFQPQRPDTDHFNRDYKPEQARGGTQLCMLDPFTGAVAELTPAQDSVWDFRARWRADSAQLTYSRARVGSPCEIWVMEVNQAERRPQDRDNGHCLTRGYEGQGADHARWLVLK